VETWDKNHQKPGDFPWKLMEKTIENRKDMENQRTNPELAAKEVAKDPYFLSTY